jgi:polysaccharide pyruvyl transferase WcaK-like protein
MEGTIHNYRIGGFTLLGFAYYAKSQGKKVAMVNGSYQNMPKNLTAEVLRKVDFLSVREIESFNYLKSLGINLNLIPDFAFRANINGVFKNIDSVIIRSSLKKCLYTVGVLGAFPNQKKGINLDQITQHIKSIKQLGYVPYFLKIEEAEDIIENHLKYVGVSTISYNNGLEYSNIGSVLSEFDLLVTGRYHIGIFGLMSKIKTLFLPSNTFKIEGLLKMINQESLMILENDIEGALNKLEDKNQNLINVLISRELYDSFSIFLKNIKS